MSGDVFLQRDVSKPEALSFLACKAMGATCTMVMGHTAAKTLIDVTIFQRQRPLGLRMFWPLPTLFELLKLQFYQGNAARWMCHRWKAIQDQLGARHPHNYLFVCPCVCSCVCLCTC
jgi:hypothetical protein